MITTSAITVIPLYAAILGLMFVPLTMHVASYRIKNKVGIGDDGSGTLLKRVRCQGNFVETVPIALILLLCVELMGASATWLHSLGGLLVAGRVAHYLGFSGVGPFMLRPVGMVATLTTYLVSSGWIIAQCL